MSEVALTPETISRFRRNYIEAFGAPNRDDALYAAVSEGRRFAGMEHWLPFFYGGLETLFDYLPAAPIVFDHLAREAMDERHALIEDYYQARRQQAGSALKNTVPYQPVPPALMYLSPDEVAAALPDRLSVEFTPFATPEAGARKVLHAGSRQGRGFELERADPSANVFQAAVDHIASLRANKRKVVVAGWTEGSRDRLAQILTEHGLGSFKPVSTLDDAERLAAGQVGLRFCRSNPVSRRTGSPSSPNRIFSATAWCGAPDAGAPPTLSPRHRRFRPATLSCMPSTA